MRLLSLAFSFVLTATIATLALTYVAERVGRNRIQVQDGWISSSEPAAFQAYGGVDSTQPDTLLNVTAEGDAASGR